MEMVTTDHPVALKICLSNTSSCFLWPPAGTGCMCLSRLPLTNRSFGIPKLQCHQNKQSFLESLKNLLHNSHLASVWRGKNKSCKCFWCAPYPAPRWRNAWTHRMKIHLQKGVKETWKRLRRWWRGFVVERRFLRLPFFGKKRTKDWR